MNTSLTREHFVDRTVSPEELEGVVQMLSDWYFQSAPDRPPTTLGVGLHLWGFPRAQGEALLALLEARSGAEQAPAVSASLTNPDILSLRAEELPLKPGAPPPAAAGALLRLLGDPAFQGLWCELRLSLRPPENERTMVLAGTLQSERFFLKALWPAGKGGFTEEIFASTGWPEEAGFIAAFYNHWTGRPTLPDFARAELFPDSTGQATSGFLAWFLFIPEKGFGAFILRVALASATAALSAAGFFWAQQAAPMLSLLFILAGALALLGAGFHLVLKGSMIAQARRLMADSYKRIYSQPITHPEVDLAQEPGVLQDPAVRKISAEIEAAGGRHFKDVTTDPPIQGRHTIRLYLFPEDATLFTVMLMHHSGTHSVFPAKPTFLLRTGLEGNLRLVSLNGGGGWRPSLNPAVLARLFSGVSSPAEMLEKHRAALRKEEARTGRRPVPLEPEHILEEMVREHEEARAEMAKYGYFRWPDAFRMVFDITLPEYRP